MQSNTFNTLVNRSTVFYILYIYIFIFVYVIGGISSAIFQIKIGREMSAGARLKHWSNHYRNLHLRALMEQQNTFVPAYKKVERLALMVIKYLAQHKAYLDPDSMKAGIPPRPRPKGSKERCLIASCASFQYLLSYHSSIDNILQAKKLTGKSSQLILTQTACILLRKRWFAW